MTFNPQFSRTQDERIDIGKPQINLDKDDKREALIVAHCERVQEEYFDSGLYHKETHHSELIDD